MKNKARDINTYQFSDSEPLLLDTNIWIYLFPPPVNPQPKAIVRNYSNALKSMLRAKTRILMDVLVLSEYLNKYCRCMWSASNTSQTYKDFRKTANYPPIGQQASSEARQILNLCARENHPFEGVNINQVLADFEVGKRDFNDGLLIETCRLNGWKFVTHDGDCSEGGIEILTSNCGLLRNCP